MKKPLSTLQDWHLLRPRGQLGEREGVMEALVVNWERSDGGTGKLDDDGDDQLDAEQWRNRIVHRPGSS
ncbi:hypothetical protein EYF80_044514 [Liparis tanakae]|uniref:Uncharacterized protein n=1 Tax=Liparis tanakae TaxID=230148 RepID=A0A4Z2FXL4_9TELE|nr:hypothetical protein EYF80_044514 [Liparis tanakae]